MNTLHSILRTLAMTPALLRGAFATMCFALTLTASAQLWPEPTQLEPCAREVRAVWYCTVAGIDWPLTQRATDAASAERQKQMLRDDFDRLKEAGINVILFQCRTRGVVAYRSAYETWDDVYTGTYGKEPPYDPLAFAIEEAHKRGMELHAYMVTYPLMYAKAVAKIGQKNVVTAHPELCQKCGDRWYMDPGVPGTSEYLAKLCKEVVEKYDVDGVHLDYIRYMETSVGFNDNVAYKKYGNGKSKAQWKRDNVTDCVRKIAQAVRSVKPWVVLSCSPVGKYCDLPRARSGGWNARDAVSQDAQLWLRENIMDWLIPMLYFDGNNFYPFVVNWQQESYGHVIVPGLGVYLCAPDQKNWKGEVVTRQMNVSRQMGCQGIAFFRSKFLLDNHKGVCDFTRDFFRQPALTPASTWLDSTPPASPVVQAELKPGYVVSLDWQPVADATPIVYNIYHENADGNVTMLAHHQKGTHFDFAPAICRSVYDRLYVRAMDAYGNESPLVPVQLQREVKPAPEIPHLPGM